MKQIVLASGSPRRKQLLEQRGLTIIAKPSGVDEEHLDPSLSPLEIAIDLSQQKARTVAKDFPHSIVIGADEVVMLDGKSIGKPSTINHAIEILKSLSGKTHSVITAFTIIDTESNVEITKSDETLITFRKLSDMEINSYVKTKKPLDKAGGYGIQEEAGSFVESIKGDYENVVGLPSSIFTTLEEFGVKINAVK